MKVFNVYPDTGCNPHCEKSVKDAIMGIQTWLEEGTISAIITVEILEMSEEDFAALPEYDGP